LKKELNRDKEELAQKDRKVSVISDEMKIKDEIIKKTINVDPFKSRKINPL